jgi:hypothetical protein
LAAERTAGSGTSLLSNMQAAAAFIANAEQGTYVW